MWEYRQQYCSNPCSGKCQVYNKGDENTMIACCNDGTRPVIFKIERIDYE